MRKRFGNQVGFTLIEMLIVIIILGILAAVIIPQVTVSTEDAKLSTLKTNLTGMRSTIEIYYAQHNNVYPGLLSTTVAGTTNNAVDAASAFVDQLTTYTENTGIANNDSANLSGTILGPYLKDGLPKNPFNDKNDVVCDVTTTNVTTKASGGADKGWKFYCKTGVLMAADGAHETE